MQCVVMLRRLCAPEGTIGVLRSGIFLSAMTASPPSTFFFCAFRAAVAAIRAVVVRKLRRAVSLLPSPDLCAGFSHRRTVGVLRAQPESDSLVLAGVDAVPTSHTTAVIYLMSPAIDTRSLAFAGTERNGRKIPISYPQDKSCCSRFVRCAMPARQVQ